MDYIYFLLQRFKKKITRKKCFLKSKICAIAEYFDITLSPENTEELLAALRYSANAKMEKPYVSFSFKSGALYIYLKKVKDIAQVKSICKS